MLFTTLRPGQSVRHLYRDLRCNHVSNGVCIVFHDQGLGDQVYSKTDINERARRSEEPIKRVQLPRKRAQSRKNERRAERA